MPRILAAEMMDDPGQDQAAFSTALDELGRLNRLSLAHRPLRRFLDDSAVGENARPLSLLDVGAGGGDALRAAAAWGAARGVALDLWGLDRSPWAERHAMARGTPARWITCDLFDLPPGRRFDLVICSLFAHHLDDDGVVRFLRWLRQRAIRRWLILDLHRHRLAWAGVWLGTRALGMSRMVRHDGPVSVMRGFTRQDWRRLTGAAGVEAEIRWGPPFRWAVTGEGRCTAR